jgi:predicted subunit of tRNA(5-methylaminomethyl-2-thiouridylate) methyltransferase
MSKEIERNKHPNKTEMEHRINVITSAIVDGFGRNDILHQKEVKTWNVTSRTIDNYIREARQKIIEDIAEERISIIETSIRRLERIYQKALADENYKEANNAIMNIAKITGVISNTINFQQNNLIQNNDYSGNDISKDYELIELTEELAERLANSKTQPNIVNALSN